MSTKFSINDSEITYLTQWLESQTSVPQPIKSTINKLKLLPAFLNQNSLSQAALARYLKAAYGFTSSSEKGDSLPKM